MVLVDTSVWINHLRDKETHLEKLLLNGEVIYHPHIIGDINRIVIESALKSKIPVFTPTEFLSMLESLT